MAQRSLVGFLDEPELRRVDWQVRLSGGRWLTQVPSPAQAEKVG